MNQHLQSILTIIQQDEHLSAEQKAAISKSLKDVDKELEITAFKLDRTEKVKRTTAILLEETIEELEQKRKAVEAQNRELEIETALERVRAIALSMKEPADMLEVCKIISQQIALLHVKELRNVQTAIIYESKGTYLNYEYYAKHDKLLCTEVDFKSHPIQKKFAEQMLRGAEELFTVFVKDKELKDWYAYQKTTNQFADTYLETATSLNYYWYSLGPVALGISTYVPLTEEEINLFKRFRNVFELAYRRFLDIEKAEAQAKEAQIEAALENVRSASLSMHRSDQLKTVAVVMFKKLMELGFTLDGAFIFLFDKLTRNLQLWIATTTLSEPDEISIPYSPAIGKNRIFKDLWSVIETGEEIFNRIYSGKTKDDYFSHVGAHNDFPQAVKDFHLEAGSWITSIAGGKHCSVGFDSWSGQLSSEDDYKILKRFARAFEQAYTRFLDLQKAEAQTKESQIETALERVRSRTLAMQRSDELAETAAVLFKQLIQLGIAPNRLYIAIIEDKNGYTEFWITDEDGSKVSSAFHTNLNDNPSFKKMFVGWQQERKSLIIDMQGDELQEYFKYLGSIHVPFKGGLTQKRRIQHVAYFSKGFIGIASPDDQTEETMVLLERFAAVFNLTFTRFNDLKIAEAHAIQAEEDLIKLQTEKKRAENALTNLQAAQKQLIQSEKMASLGELTAGIAHEIQNPLNFVNNFSEVSKELLDEMKIELNNGNIDDATDIAGDVIQNLEKILHHGKRADAIVKGMLQHSRTSSATKEPTDINALADEYLRLAYHGLRAKDKSFNASLKTDYDESISNINVIPQDLGRVILNLITNAFYAVDEKRKLGSHGYQPLVSVGTKKLAGKILIKVSDNGNGIPQNIVDKIFQPFFTTKPTGQGTGLGLSLSYDIIKAHNGEIKVESKQGEGTIFIITMPTY